MTLLDPRSLGFAVVGANARIYDLTRITSAELISLGHDVLIDDFVFLQGAGGLTIGSHVHIASFASITGGGEGIVGDFCTVSSGARVFTGTDVIDGSGLCNSTIPDHLRAVRRGRTTLGPHSFVGANAVVLPNVVIGEGAVVGAGAVVTADLTPWTINVGVPAREVRERPRDEILARAAKLVAT
jgi:acetyltransferase-like isoleucine patch superfamily enzyme